MHTSVHTRSLIDALPVSVGVYHAVPVAGAAVRFYRTLSLSQGRSLCDLLSVALSLGLPPPDVIRHLHFVEPGLSSRMESMPAAARPSGPDHRSTEHTSELPSLMRISYAVFCLKKKNIN